MIKKMNAKNIRKQRGRQSTNIYLRRVKIINDLSREYYVIGSSGNEYKVLINNNPCCTCPDFQSRNMRCKHIYYVLDQILNVGDEIIDIKNYSDSNLRNLFGYEKVEDEENDKNKIKKSYLNPNNIMNWIFDYIPCINFPKNEKEND